MKPTSINTNRTQYIEPI